MADIVYTDHLKLRLKIRKISYDYPNIIFNEPEQEFFDRVEENYIAIKKLKYSNKERNMMIAYEKKGSDIEIITIHPIKEEKIINRTISGRWKKNE